MKIAVGGTNKGNIHELQVLQNQAARTVLHLPSRSHREDMYKKLSLVDSESNCDFSKNFNCLQDKKKQGAGVFSRFSVER